MKHQGLKDIKNYNNESTMKLTNSCCWDECWNFESSFQWCLIIDQKHQFYINCCMYSCKNVRNKFLIVSLCRILFWWSSNIDAAPIFILNLQTFIGNLISLVVLFIQVIVIDWICGFLLLEVKTDFWSKRRVFSHHQLHYMCQQLSELIDHCFSCLNITNINQY